MAAVGGDLLYFVETYDCRQMIISRLKNRQIRIKFGGMKCERMMSPWQTLNLRTDGRLWRRHCHPLWSIQRIDLRLSNIIVEFQAARYAEVTLAISA
jgi:hypothetical protein